MEAARSEAAQEVSASKQIVYAVSDWAGSFDALVFEIGYDSLQLTE